MENTNVNVLKEMYTKLFNEITDIQEELQKIVERLKNIQLETEDMYINNKYNK